MKAEWVEHLETSVPDLVGFGRLVNFRNGYWHPMDETSKVDGLELTKLAGEAVRVAGMYKLKTDRLKFETRHSTVYVVACGKTILCGLLPNTSEHNEDHTWESLARSLELMNQFLEGAAS